MSIFRYPFNSRTPDVPDALTTALQSNFREAATDASVTTAVAGEAAIRAAADVVLQGNIDAHVNDTTDAHDASAISSVATGDVSATDVQSAIAELASEKLSAATAASTYVELAGDTMTGNLIVNAASPIVTTTKTSTTSAASIAANATGGRLDLYGSAGASFGLGVDASSNFASLDSGRDLRRFAGNDATNDDSVPRFAQVKVMESGIIIPAASSVQVAMRQVEAYVQNLEERFEQHHHDERYPRRLKGMEMLRDMGSVVLASSFDPTSFPATPTTAALNDGEVRLTAVWLPEPATITGAWHHNGAVASFTPDNNSKMGLYRKTDGAGTFTRVAASANSTAWMTSAATSFTQLAFSAPVYCTPGLYFVAMLANWSAVVTPPASYAMTLGGGAAFLQGGLTASNLSLMMNVTGQTDLPATLTPTSGAGGVIFCGLY